MRLMSVMMVMAMFSAVAACGGADVDVDLEALPVCEYQVIRETPPGVTGPGPALVEVELAVRAEDRCEDLEATYELFAPAAETVTAFQCRGLGAGASASATFDAEEYSLALLVDGEARCAVHRTTSQGGSQVIRLAR